MQMKLVIKSNRNSKRSLSNRITFKKCLTSYVVSSVLFLSACGSIDKTQGAYSAPVLNAKARAEMQEKVTPPPTSIDTLKTLVKPNGLNTKRLFVERLDDPELRMQRVENSVQKVRDDLDTVSPSIVRLVAVEKDIRQLITQLEGLAREEKLLDSRAPVESGKVPNYLSHTDADHGSVAGMHAPDASSPVPLLPSNGMEKQTGLDLKPKASTHEPEKHVQQSNNLHSIVKKLRIGEHSDKTRLVIEMTEKISPLTRLSEDSRTVTVSLDGADWQTLEAKSMPYAPLIRSYRVVKTQKGANLKILLRYPAETIDEMIYNPNGHEQYRIILDIFSPDTHIK